MPVLASKTASCNDYLTPALASHLQQHEPCQISKLPVSRSLATCATVSENRLHPQRWCLSSGTRFQNIHNQIIIYIYISCNYSEVALNVHTICWSLHIVPTTWNHANRYDLDRLSHTRFIQTSHCNMRTMCMIKLYLSWKAWEIYDFSARGVLQALPLTNVMGRWSATWFQQNCLD